MKWIGILCLLVISLSSPALACIPSQEASPARSTTPVYLQIHNTKFSIPQKYLSVSMPGFVKGFSIYYNQRLIDKKDFKVQLKADEEIYVGYGRAFLLDDIYFQHPVHNSEDEVRHFLQQFILNSTPPDWDSTMNLAQKLNVEKLPDLNACAYMYAPQAALHIEDIPSLSVIEEAVKHPNSALRWAAVRWLLIDPRKSPENIQILERVMESDPDKELRLFAKKASSGNGGSGRS